MVQGLLSVNMVSAAWLSLLNLTRIKWSAASQLCLSLCKDCAASSLCCSYRRVLTRSEKAHKMPSVAYANRVGLHSCGCTE
eukprot:1154197-Pelagomonas_calceolata.AAC.4